MSLFLLQLEEWEPQMAAGVNTAGEDELEEEKQQQFIARVNQVIFRQMRRHRNYADIAVFEDYERKRDCMIIQFSGFSLRGLLSFNYNKQRRTSSCSVDILDSSGEYLKSGTSQQANQLCRALVFNESYLHILCKIGICMGNGQLKIQIPYFLHAYTHMIDYTYEKHNESAVLVIFKRFIEKYLPFLNSVLKILLPPEIKISKTSQETELLAKIHKYCDMICVSSNLSESFLQTEKQTLYKHHNNQLSIRKMIDNKVKDSMPGCKLFVHTLEESKIYEKYRLSSEQIKIIQMLIAMPFQPRSPNPYENTVVLNHILIHQPPNIQFLTKINQGGFSTIFMAQLNFWYVESSEGYESYVRSDNLTMRKLLQKWVVVKQQEGKRKGKRTAHEVNILKNIKNGCSVFLPKYYIPVNQPNPYPNSIIIDYVPYHNLSQFIVATKPTISLVSKLYVMFSLVQALRYLKDYKIVHLDLKPQNIMLYANYLIKLVDFGQSYHPQVCSQNHKPGFTPPYSCPQTFKSGANFTAKSDVYSLGVLFFQILYGVHPYEINERVSIKKGMKQYLSRWIFTPEQYQNYGDNTVLRILNNLINKCVSVLPEQRPELDWLAVVLRFCFELIS